MENHDHQPSVAGSSGQMALRAARRLAMAVFVIAVAVTRSGELRAWGPHVSCGTPYCNPWNPFEMQVECSFGYSYYGSSGPPEGYLRYTWCYEDRQIDGGPLLDDAQSQAIDHCYSYDISAIMADFLCSDNFPDDWVPPYANGSFTCIWTNTEECPE